ncbi:MAG: sensor domain-containing protein [Chloroflexota bacterium]
MDSSKNWLDVLSDGQMFRDWFSLIAHFFLGIAYLTFLSAGFAFALGTSVILVGIPLLLFMLATTRVLARIDRQIMCALLNSATPEVTDDVDARGANLGERLGMYLGSGTTWRSLIYLLLKLPIGIMTISAAFLILPLLALEVLVLAPLTIDMRLISVRMLHWVAVGTHKFSGVLLPTSKSAGKRKRDTGRLETVEADPGYFIDDDGEIAAYKRFS